MINNEVYVLFIDDDDLSDHIEKTQINLLRGQLGLKIRPTVIDMSSDAFKSANEKGDVTLDIKIIKSYLEENCLNTKFDIVACDYSFANDPNVTGFHVLKHIINFSRSHKCRIKNAKFIFYSSEEEESLKSMFEHNELKQLIRLKVDGFFNRDHLPIELPKMFESIQKEINFSKYISEQLAPFKDHLFMNTYPKFEGKTMEEIASEIELGGDHGRAFQKEIIDVAIAKMLKMNGIEQGS